jgi:subtilisin family serine protease
MDELPMMDRGVRARVGSGLRSGVRVTEQYGRANPLSLASPADSIALLEGLELLWAQTKGAPEICVAVLDGPVDLLHSCFDGARLAQPAALVPGGSTSGNAAYHGTHVASIIFGQPGGPVRGIAPGCSGLILPVFAGEANGELGPCSQLDLARAILQAVQLGAQVINISGGQMEASGEAHPVLADAISACARQGVLIVAAAGNDGCACLHIPAALPAVLVVGAMDKDGSPLSFSNWGESYETHGILAPGAGHYRCDARRRDNFE